MRLNVIAERFQEVHYLFLRGSVEALRDDRVDGDGINGLFGFLFGFGERIAQRGEIERGTGRGDEILTHGFKLFGRWFRLPDRFTGRRARRARPTHGFGMDGIGINSSK